MQAVVAFLIGHLVVALMLSIGLAARPRDLAQILDRPLFYLRAVVAMVVGVPILAMVVVSALGLPPVAAALILLMAICPGAPFIPAATRTKGTAYSTVGLNLLVLASMLAPLTIPVWTAIIARGYPFEFQITSLQLLARVLQVVILPLAVGIALRLVWPRAADVLARVVHVFFVVALVVALIAALYLGAPVLLEVRPATVLAVFLVVAGAAAMGLWAAARQPDARHTTAVAVALGNPMLALAIVAASYPGFRAAAFIAAYLIARKLALLPIEAWIKRRMAPKVARPTAGQPHAVGAL